MEVPYEEPDDAIQAAPREGMKEYLTPLIPSPLFASLPNLDEPSMAALNVRKNRSLYPYWVLK